MVGRGTTYTNKNGSLSLRGISLNAIGNEVILQKFRVTVLVFKMWVKLNNATMNCHRTTMNNFQTLWYTYNGNLNTVKMLS